MSDKLLDFSKMREKVLEDCGLKAVNSGIYRGEWAYNREK